MAKSNRDGIQVTTGEQIIWSGNSREFISFTDDISTAVSYASINSTDENEKGQSFGIMIGMSIDSLQCLRTCDVWSDTPEVGIIDNIPVEHIKMLMVPPGKEEVVKKMVGDLPIQVATFDIEDPFYKMGKNGIRAQLEILEQETTQQTQSKSEYTKQDMESLAKGRKLSRIFDWIDKLKEKIVDRGTEENVR